jgi:hypothetical protein
MSPASQPSFTLKQGQYLAFIQAYTQLNARPPAEADFQRFLRVTPPSVHQMILTLERAGLIRRQPGIARSIQLLVDLQALPVLQNQTVKNLCAEVLAAATAHEGRDAIPDEPLVLLESMPAKSRNGQGGGEELR